MRGTSYFVKRFPFLDWMRGLAVVIMIQCHTFNSLIRTDLREGGPYVLSQFVGGMAAPLFLFMAGMTLAFQMDGLERREPGAGRRWLGALRRAFYVWGIAYLFRFTNCVASLPKPDWREFTKVDILNCMGLAMVAFSPLAMLRAKDRARFGALAGLAVAALSPLIANLAWEGVPPLVREYLAPVSGQGRGHFPFFPNAAYLGFGLAAGTVVKRSAEERFERLMQWSLLLGLALILCGEYFSNIPYSIYTRSNFWTDSPALIVIRAGIALLLVAGCYLWTEYCVGPGWSWMQTLGKNSLMVYWVHVMLVYGNIAYPWKLGLGVTGTSLATLLVTVLMVVMSVYWLRWKAQRAERWRLETSVAGTRRPVEAV
jgi:uncharacterized membrane protein